jgi:hypothetical protein
VNLLQDAVDTIVLTTRVGRSRARDLAQAKQQLAPSPVLGVVLVDGGSYSWCDVGLAR